MAWFKFSNSWSKAAAVDPRFRDRLEMLEPPGPGVDQTDEAGAAERTEAPPAGTVTHQSRVTESWGNWWKRGAEHPQARLSADDVREIRRLHTEGIGYRRLGKRFNVHHQTVQAIVTGRSWSRVK